MIQFVALHSSHLPHIFRSELWFGVCSEEVFEKLNCLCDFRNLCKLTNCLMPSPLQTSFQRIQVLCLCMAYLLLFPLWLHLSYTAAKINLDYLQYSEAILSVFGHTSGRFSLSPKCVDVLFALPDSSILNLQITSFWPPGQGQILPLHMLICSMRCKVLGCNRLFVGFSAMCFSVEITCIFIDQLPGT